MPTSVEAPAGRLSPRTTVSVRVTPNINVDTLKNLVASICGRSGCLTCGLLGIDIRLQGDPAELAEFTKMQGVQSVSIE